MNKIPFTMGRLDNAIDQYSRSQGVSELEIEARNKFVSLLRTKLSFETKSTIASVVMGSDIEKLKQLFVKMEQEIGQPLPEDIKLDWLSRPRFSHLKLIKS